MREFYLLKKIFDKRLVAKMYFPCIFAEYVKVAARFERVFIKAWKRFFPPSDLEEFSERARQEELDCISLLGALDRSIKEEVAVGFKICLKKFFCRF